MQVGLLVGFAALAGAGLAGCKPAVPDAEAARAAEVPALTVAVATVQTGALPRVVSVTGTVAPWQELAVDAEAGGLAVREVTVKENDAVRAGDVLVRFDDRVLKAQVAGQEAALAEARATLATARQVAGRGEDLVAQRVLSQEAVETRRTAVLTSQAKADAAAAALDQLRAQLDRTVVRAPADGIVSTDPVRIGAVPASGTELLRLVRDGRLEVQAKVPERDLGAVAAGAPARVVGPDGKAVEARVRDVAAKLDPGTRLGVAYVALPAGTTLRSGMFARVEITAGAAEGPVVPEQALVWPDGKASAFAVDEGRAKLRPLDLGERRDGSVRVLGGLAAGERVVVAGAGFLHDGDRVRVEPALSGEKLASDR